MEEEEEDGQYIVTSSLAVAPVAKATIEAIVQARSRVESFGNAVFTLSALRRFESGQEFTKESMSQSCFSACMRAVCSRVPGTGPVPVEYEHKDVEAYIRSAAETVVSTMTVFDNDKGLTQTFNQAARRYNTVLKNNFFMRLSAWQGRELRAELRSSDSPHSQKSKKFVNFIVRATGRLIGGGKLLDPTCYKSAEIKQYTTDSDVFVQEIVKRHRQQLSTALTLKTGGDFEGTFAKKLVKNNVHMYARYAIYLQRRTETLEALSATEEKPAKSPFQVFPQLTMKVRAVTFGKEQIVELVTALASDSSMFEGQSVANHITDMFRDVHLPSVIDKSAGDLERRRGHMLDLESAQAAAVAKLEERRQDDEKKITSKQEAAAEKDIAKRAETIVKERKKLTDATSAQRKRLVGLEQRRLKLRALEQAYAAEVAKLERRRAEKSLTEKQEASASKALASKARTIEQLSSQVEDAAPGQAQRAPKRKREDGEARSAAKGHKTCSRDTWAAISDLVADRLFQVPWRQKKRWTRVVTTDGVRANWHCERKSVDSASAAKSSKCTSASSVDDPKQSSSHKNSSTSKSRTPDPKPCESLKVGHYGAHKHDVTFGEELGDFNIIAVDPGHVDLISAVRIHSTPESLRLVLPPTAPNRRKRALQAADEALSRTRFTLSNKEWSQNCGRLLNQARNLKLSDSLGLQPGIDLLAQASSRTGFVAGYVRHIEARSATATLFQTRMHSKCTRRWKFESYQKEQRAVPKLCTALLGGLSPTDTVVVWGNGGFGPTSKGHASAPNQKLQKALSRFVPLVLGSEYRSSKTSCCCHCQATGLKKVGYRRRATVVQCQSEGCKRLLGRDVNTAQVIADIFASVRATPNSHVLPLWISDDDVRKNNSTTTPPSGFDAYLN